MALFLHVFRHLAGQPRGLGRSALVDGNQDAHLGLEDGTAPAVAILAVYRLPSIDLPWGRALRARAQVQTRVHQTSLVTLQGVHDVLQNWKKKEDTDDQINQ